MEKEMLDKILAAHKLWIESSCTQGEKADLRGADLSKADLREADLREANLYGANLIGADLRGADLRKADLRKADLRGANLYGANLYEADLSKANLSGANLIGADLRGADLRGADLSGANLYFCTGILSAQSPSSGRITYFHPYSDYIQNGYQRTNLEGFRAAVADDYPDTESAERRGYEAIIQLFEVYKKK